MSVDVSKVTPADVDVLVEIRDLLRALVEGQPRLAYDAASAARLMSVGETMIRQRVREGLLRKVPHMGARVIIPHAELERWLMLGDLALAKAAS